MDFIVLANTIGGLLILLGAVLFVPAVFSYSAGLAFTTVFFDVGCAAIISGGLLWGFTRNHCGEVNHRVSFALVTMVWLSSCLLGSLPYYFSGTLPSLVDCLFESTSGFTGTGSSVLNELEKVDPAILLWRSMTQWLGGMGIIVFFTAILPILGVGGVQLFRVETSGPRKDRIATRVRDVAKKLWLVYFGFTVTLIIALLIEGASFFDAVNHAMTTLPAGGFSTHDNGIAAFGSMSAEYTVAIFMILASINFSLHYRLIALRETKVFADKELKFYLSVVAVSVAVVTAVNWNVSYNGLEEAFRKSFFTVAAAVSCTGFTNADYAQWPQFTGMVLLLLMAMGGMAGSTAGGVKCIRVMAALKLFAKEMKQSLHPSAVLSIRIGDSGMKTSIASAIWAIILVYFFVFAVIVMILTWNGLDLVSAASGTISALSNVGPGLAKLGPMENYAFLPDSSKLALAAGMILGRLEFLTVLVIFTPAYWKR